MTEPVVRHFGVPGMRWGVRKTKADRQAIAERDVSILSARSQHKGLKRDLKTAKKQYKVDKKELGRDEAKRILEVHGSAYAVNRRTARQKTSNEIIEKAIDDSMNTLIRDLRRQ